MQRRRGVRNSQRIANRKENDGKGVNDGDNAMDVNIENEINTDDYQKGVEIATAATEGESQFIII